MNLEEARLWSEIIERQIEFQQMQARYDQAANAVDEENLRELKSRLREVFADLSALKEKAAGTQRTM
jgi:hypothetical protein